MWFLAGVRSSGDPDKVWTHIKKSVSESWRALAAALAAALASRRCNSRRRNPGRCPQRTLPRLGLPTTSSLSKGRLDPVVLLRTVILAMLLRLVVDVHPLMLLGTVMLQRLVSAAPLLALRRIGSRHQRSHAPRAPCFCSALCPQPPGTPSWRSTMQQAALGGRANATGSTASRVCSPRGAA